MMPTITWPQRLSEPAGAPAAGEVHLWQTSLDEVTADGGISCSALSIRERERARRFVFEKHHKRYLSGRAWLRSVLGACLNLPPAAVPLTINAYGKPCIAPEANLAGLKFNLSHCGGLALLAVTTQREIGVDLQSELEDAVWPAIAERFCVSQENKYIQNLPPTMRSAAFAQIWTRKEAAGKASGEGLTSRIFSTPVGPADWGTIDCGGGLSVWSLPTRNRFAAAIAVCEPA